MPSNRLCEGCGHNRVDYAAEGLCKSCRRRRLDAGTDEVPPPRWRAMGRRDDIRELREQGLTVSAIADRMGLCERTVTRWLNQ